MPFLWLDKLTLAITLIQQLQVKGVTQYIWEGTVKDIPSWWHHASDFNLLPYKKSFKVIKKVSHKSEVLEWKE